MQENDLGVAPTFHWNKIEFAEPDGFILTSLGGTRAFAFGSKVYAFGGDTDLSQRDNPRPGHYWILVLDTVTWEWLPIPAPLDYRLLYGHVGFAKDDKVYIVGGGRLTECLTSQYCFDVVDQSFSKIDIQGHNPFPLKMSSGTYVEALDEFVIYGGYKADGTILADVVCLNVDSMEWYLPVVKGAGPSPRIQAACCSTGRTVFIYGGSGYGLGYFGDIFALTKFAGTWTWNLVCDPTNEVLPPRKLSEIHVAHGRLLILGGAVESMPFSSNSLHVYSRNDRAIDKVKLVSDGGDSKYWSSGDIPPLMYDHRMVRVGTKILVIGERIGRIFMSLEHA